MSDAVVLQHDWYPAPVPANVRIGQRTWIHSSFAFLHYHSRRPCGVDIGNDSGIYKGTFFELGPDGEVVIGDYCTVVGAIFATNGRITIGDYALISHAVVLADHDASHPPVASDASHAPARGITIGRNCWIGARAVLLGGCRIGDNSVIGAGSVVRGVVPPNVIAAGNPLRVVKSLK